MLKTPLLFAGAAMALALYAPDLIRTLQPRPAAPTHVAALSATPEPDTQSAAAEQADMHGEKTLPRDANGQYWTEALIAGERVRFIVDTGATFVSIPAEFADRLGLDTQSGRKFIMTTANGRNIAVETTLPNVDLGTIYVKDVKAVVTPRGIPPVFLLGESFLQRLTSVEQRNGSLVLRQ